MLIFLQNLDYLTLKLMILRKFAHGGGYRSMILKLGQLLDKVLSLTLREIRQLRSNLFRLRLLNLEDM